MSVMLRFENRETDEHKILGPFDWIEIDGDKIIAESNDGNIRHEDIAIQQLDKGWWTDIDTDKAYSWPYFVIYQS